MASLVGDRLERGLGERVGLERIRSWVEPRFHREERQWGQELQSMANQDRLSFWVPKTLSLFLANCVS